MNVNRRCMYNTYMYMAIYVRKPNFESRISNIKSQRPNERVNAKKNENK